MTEIVWDILVCREIPIGKQWGGGGRKDVTTSGLSLQETILLGPMWFWNDSLDGLSCGWKVRFVYTILEPSSYYWKSCIALWPCSLSLSLSDTQPADVAGLFSWLEWGSSVSGFWGSSYRQGTMPSLHICSLEDLNSSPLPAHRVLSPWALLQYCWEKTH